ncbi:MAG: DUF1810 domain-containing protein [Methylocystis sp.]|uniref:DUF1810 domain-containing protein n=1 Tax=Methylocystis sp. TaxID=1911079 RepID=UPI003DA5DBD6
MSDPFKLQRFLDAQSGDYDRALAEIRAGRKASHWIWYVFPQMKGLGFSRASEFYGLSGADEARAWLAHPILGPRLRACVEAMLAHTGSAEDILGGLDALKFRSSMTLFAAAAPGDDLFETALRRFFTGPDDKTLALLARKAQSPSG